MISQGKLFKLYFDQNVDNLKLNLYKTKELKRSEIEFILVSDIKEPFFVLEVLGENLAKILTKKHQMGYAQTWLFDYCKEVEEVNVS